MAALKLTLQNRITTLMIISSAIFISAFTFIQVNNQVENLRRYNAYRSSLSTMIVKNNLETVIRESPPEEIAVSIQESAESMREADIIEDIIVFDEAGKVIASTEPSGSGETVSYKDIDQLDALKDAASSDKWFVSTVDRLRQQLKVYIALNRNAAGPIAYVAKLTMPMADARQALKEVYTPVLIAVVIVILANIIFGFMLSKAIVGPVKTLNEVTKIIAAGDLNIRTNIRTEDELQELGETFNFMTEELVKMKERAENANPLTKLPGNIVIHEQIENRLKKNEKFVVIYCDLDNFKAFNDKYGIAKGDEAIKLSSDIFKEAIKAKGGAEDFIGHEGGDDFLLLTTPENTQQVADYIISEFDKRIRALYNEEDLKQGFIVAHARDGEIKQFPVMTISLAGVTNTHRPISSYGEVTNIAAEVKKKAKDTEGSVFVVDKRQA